MTETPDESIAQDPGIPGADTISDDDAPERAEAAPGENRHRPDDLDHEGHMGEGA